MSAAVRLQGVTRGFIEAGHERSVLRGIDLEVRLGELVAIVGPSGSGKTSLLNVIGALDGGYGGTASIFGEALEPLDDDGRTAIRNAHIGFVFQSFHLLDHLSVLENVQVPMWLSRNPAPNEDERAKASLQSVGLDGRQGARVSALSGGERQRVAIARAMVNQPKLVLADEPTGNLDADTGTAIYELFDSLRADAQCAVVVVTHDPRVSDRADRVLTLRDGRLTSMPGGGG